MSATRPGEEFMDFVQAEKSASRELARLILEQIKKWGLDIERFCRGQGYDGASNMSAANGVQGLIARQAPNACCLYLHCSTHVLNSCVVETCQLPGIKDMNGIICNLSTVFWASNKRQLVLEKVLEKESPLTRKTHFKSLSRTRWVERHQAYETFHEL